MNFEYQEGYPHGIMFHRFHGNNVPALQGSIDSSQLENLIIKIGIERILSPTQWLEKIKNTMFNSYLLI